MRQLVSGGLYVVGYLLLTIAVIMFFVVHPIVFVVLLGLVVAPIISYIGWSAFGPLKKG